MRRKVADRFTNENLLKRLHKFASKDRTRQYLGGVLVREQTIDVTDGHRCVRVDRAQAPEDAALAPGWYPTKGLYQKENTSMPDFSWIIEEEFKHSLELNATTRQWLQDMSQRCKPSDDWAFGLYDGCLAAQLGASAPRLIVAGSLYLDMREAVTWNIAYLGEALAFDSWMTGCGDYRAVTLNWNGERTPVTLRHEWGVQCIMPIDKKLAV